MRLKRPRLSLKSSLGLVAGCAAILAGLRIYREGPRLHYTLLKYQFGGIEGRRTALDELRMIGIERFNERGALGPLVLPLLVETLGDRDPTMRMKAAGALGFFGSEQTGPIYESAARALAGAPWDKTGNGWIPSLVCLRAFDRYPDITNPVYTRASEDADADVRMSAIHGLLHRALNGGSASVIPLLLRKLKEDKNARVRSLAASSLNFLARRLPGSNAALKLEVSKASAVALGDEAPRVRRTVADQLKWIARFEKAYWWPVGGLRPTILALIKALDDDDPEVRGDAALALWYLGIRNDRLTTCLRELSQRNPYSLARDEAREILKTANGGATP